MPKASNNVLSTDRELKAAVSISQRTDFRVGGAPGLQLRVTDSGTKTWAVVYKSPATGRWSKVALGHYPALKLAEAKARAGDVGADVRKGHDPVHDRRQEALTETFELLSRRYMREHETRNARAGQRNRSTREAQRQLDKDILPRIGRIRTEAVSRLHVMQVVEAIADRGSYVAADRALGLIRAIYNWSCGTGRTDCNPTLGLKKRNAVRAKTRVLTPGEIRAFWNVTENTRGVTPAIRHALRLQLLTGARIGEVIGAARSELDHAKQIWTIPGARTKNGREHILPLSPLAVSIFEAALQLADVEERRRAERVGRCVELSKWVFPSAATTGPILAHAATHSIVRNRFHFNQAGISSFNTHDLRRTLATQLGEMGVADQIIERILNHSPRTVTGKHYNHAGYLLPMRQALEAWAARLKLILGEEAEDGSV